MYNNEKNVETKINLYKASYILDKRDGDIGYDLRAETEKNIVLKPNDNILIKTGVHFKFISGNYALVLPRSGLNKKGIKADIGLIDTNYRGDIGVVIRNTTDKNFIIENGDRIAQLVIYPDPNIKIKRVDNIDLDTNRGNKGFGSSGTK